MISKKKRCEFAIKNLSNNIELFLTGRKVSRVDCLDNLKHNLFETGS